MKLNDTHYRVGLTGAVGEIVDIDTRSFRVELKFADKVCEVFKINELEATTKPLTVSSYHVYKQDRLISKVTIDKMLAILDFMRKQSKPLKRSEIDESLGFSSLGLITFHIGRIHVKSLERLGLIHCNRSNSRRFSYQITEKGMRTGESEIKSQLPGYEDRQL